MRTRSRVSGLRETEAALRDLPKHTGKRLLTRVAVERLEPIAEDMRADAPVMAGELKDSINVSTRRPRRHRKRSTVEAHAGPGQQPQAIMQEFGTHEHPPQPFARPAWDKNKDGLIDGVGEDLWAGIKPAAERLGRKAQRAAGG